MAYEVVFAQAAEGDRDGIVEYLMSVLAAPQAAAHFLDELDDAIEQLGDNPFVYGLVAEERLASKGYRKALVANYVAVFSVAGETVSILRVFHQRQDYARLL